VKDGGSGPGIVRATLAREMTPVVRRRLLLTLIACAAWVASGCLSPTLPLPPPGPPEVTETETQGVYRLTGDVTPNAHVTAWNRNTNLSYGQLTASDGRYDFLVNGSAGDAMLLYYVLGTDQSEPEDFELP
jgi:hypothetical protein